MAVELEILISGETTILTTNSPIIGAVTQGGGSGTVTSVNGVSPVSGDVTVGIANISGLQTAIDGKAASSHVHPISDVTDLQVALDSKAADADLTALQTTVSGKADTAALTSGLAGKANSSHAHPISDVTGLQTALDGKSATGHTHVTSSITDFNTAVDARIQNVVGAAPAALDTLVEIAASLNNDDDFAGTMTTALAGKAALSHTHPISEITSLTTELSNKSDIAHTHSTNDIISGQLDVNRIYGGGVLFIDKSEALYGAAGSWPSARPSLPAYVKVIWMGDTDPGPLSANRDVWYQTV